MSTQAEQKNQDKNTLQAQILFSLIVLLQNAKKNQTNHDYWIACKWRYVINYHPLNIYCFNINL